MRRSSLEVCESVTWARVLPKPAVMRIAAEVERARIGQQAILVILEGDDMTTIDAFSGEAEVVGIRTVHAAHHSARPGGVREPAAIVTVGQYGHCSGDSEIALDRASDGFYTTGPDLFLRGATYVRTG